MFKIIGQKELNKLYEIIEEQNKQIDELIGMVREARNQTNDATRAYCNLVKLVNDNVKELPPEAMKQIEEITKLLEE